ncbi:MAG: lipopolysaccharide biosynthesis protein RfbH [Verrucomicrobiota bacterium]
MGIAGRLVVIDWPHFDDAGGKLRPAIILQEPDEQGDTLLIKMTGQSRYPNSFAIEPSDLADGMIYKKSFLRLDRLLSVNLSALRLQEGRLKTEKLAQLLKALTLERTRQFSQLAHSVQRPGYEKNSTPQNFIPGETVVPYAGRVFDENEVEAAVSATLDFWLTLGPEGEAFEKELAQFLGVKNSVLVNSGSSANLVAFAALTSHKLKEKQIKRGDEVITVAGGFPTTVAPIIQNGAVPVFIDNDPLTGNADMRFLEEAFVEGKTKAVMMAHTLGNPFNLSAVTEFCAKHNLWLIEDNCDALGCRYDDKLTGTFGDISTQSFYPPHHLTMGEGGAVNIVKSPRLKVLVESFRDWGRDCWCASGKDNTCGIRFDWQLGELPKGYDHKYIYSHLGYNLKPLDPQAAIGRQQLKKLPHFIQARIDNWNFLRTALADLEEFFDFSLPTHATGWSKQNGFARDKSGHRTECSWFGFMMLVKPNAPFKKREFAQALDAAKIGNRMLFGGNLVRQPAFVQLRKDYPEALRTIGDLKGADRLMNEAIFIGVYPGLTKAMLEYVAETIHNFCRRK